MSPNPLVAKLSCFGPLPTSDQLMLEQIFKERGTVERKRDVISMGDSTRFVHLVLDGWAARYKILPNGGRQITAFLLPGDLCDIHVAILGSMDHGIVALTDCRIAYADPQDIERLTTTTPGLTRALWGAALLDAAILRQWVVSNGRRSAVDAVAHLICELHGRLMMVRLADDSGFHLPLTQEELADATGVTTVHMNRVLHQLRQTGLIERDQKTLVVPDVQALRKAAGFDIAYLHLMKSDPPRCAGNA